MAPILLLSAVVRQGRRFFTGVFNPLPHLTAARGSPPLSLTLPHGGGRGPVPGAVTCVTHLVGGGRGEGEAPHYKPSWFESI